MKKSYLVAVVVSILFNLGGSIAYADDYKCDSRSLGTILPYTSNDQKQCKALMIKFENDDQGDMLKPDNCRNDVLACGIKTGNIHFAMIPYFITYITNFLLGLSGLICVFFIVIGGYRYVASGITDDKEKGKHTIRDALIGMVIALLAWTIVNVLINAVTG